VLDEGRVVEFDEPHNLIISNEGYFYDMVHSTGEIEARHLQEIAREAYESRRSGSEKDEIPEKKTSVASSGDKVIMNGPNHVSDSLSSPCSESHELSSSSHDSSSHDFDDEDMNEDSPLLANMGSEPDVTIDLSSIPISLRKEMNMLTGEEPPIHPPSPSCSRVRVPKIHVTSPSYQDLHGETEEVKNDEVYPKTVTSEQDADDLVPKITVTSPSVQDLRMNDSDEEEATASSSAHPDNNKKRTTVKSSETSGSESDNSSVSDKESGDNISKPKITVTSPSLNKIADDESEKQADDDDSMDVPKITVTSPSIQDLRDDDSDNEKENSEKKKPETTSSKNKNTEKQTETDEVDVPRITVTSPSLNDLQNDENGNDATDSSDEYSDTSTEGEMVEMPGITVTSPSFQDLQNESECNGNGKHVVSSSDEEDAGDKSPLLKDVPASAIMSADGDDNDKTNMDFTSVC
jgi:hypothetical protein